MKYDSPDWALIIMCAGFSIALLMLGAARLLNELGVCR